ncbi:hypothetical protein DFP72DRAFT_1052073 [Ephemerocybe angulata]|uniref:Uncharacterized protein n=1 Tax=Ephemerocybe angulata TaxID=980116 RepID=A0A8H6HCK8_9AGAR|nr:hypothetical protein DFP72DRAFT_1052073 [Tulosesus angulatus]
MSQDDEGVTEILPRVDHEPSQIIPVETSAGLAKTQQKFFRRARISSGEQGGRARLFAVMGDSKTCRAHGKVANHEITTERFPASGVLDLALAKVNVKRVATTNEGLSVSATQEEYDVAHRRAFIGSVNRDIATSGEDGRVLVSDERRTWNATTNMAVLRQDLCHTPGRGHDGSPRPRDVSPNRLSAKGIQNGDCSVRLKHRSTRRGDRIMDKPSKALLPEEKRRGPTLSIVRVLNLGKDMSKFRGGERGRKTGYGRTGNIIMSPEPRPEAKSEEPAERLLERLEGPLLHSCTLDCHISPVAMGGYEGEEDRMEEEERKGGTHKVP